MPIPYCRPASYLDVEMDRKREKYLEYLDRREDFSKVVHNTVKTHLGQLSSRVLRIYIENDANRETYLMKIRGPWSDVRVLRLVCVFWRTSLTLRWLLVRARCFRSALHGDVTEYK